jgi:3-oxoacyl-[acyl-carrier-protein] synthase-3
MSTALPEASRFESIGLYLPQDVLTTRDLLAQMTHPPAFDIGKMTGIAQRHVRGEDEDTLALSLKAARDCLSRSRFDAADLDVIISCAITRCEGQATYTLEPALSLEIKQALCVPQALHFDITNACAGVTTGIYILDAMIRAGTVKRGLVVSGECNTPISFTAAREISSPMDEQYASLTVGDAGVAVLMDGSSSPDDRVHYVDMVTASNSAYLCLGMPSEKSTGIALYTKNSALHHKDNMLVWPSLMSRRFAEHGSSFEEEAWDHIVPHQLGTRFTAKTKEVCEAWFGTKPPNHILVVQQCGNTSSTSHIVALYLAMQDGRIKPGEKLLLRPAASGVVTGTISVTISSMGF